MKWTSFSRQLISWHWLMLFHPSNACLLSGGLYFAWIFRSSQFCSTKLFLLTGLDCLKDLVEIKRMMIHKMNNFEKEEMVVMWWAKEIDRCYFGCFGRGVALAWRSNLRWVCGVWRMKQQFSNNISKTQTTFTNALNATYFPNNDNRTCITSIYTIHMYIMLLHPRKQVIRLVLILTSRIEAEKDEQTQQVFPIVPLLNSIQSCQNNWPISRWEHSQVYTSFFPSAIFAQNPCNKVITYLSGLHPNLLNPLYICLGEK